ncbi:hypothetical protein [Sulfitobacter sp. R18_1]|uniref:hypothetical protein n=1 Tax=Sulfitobacter sp. R18_1 TaxID=2821104 RepID=UPI001AD9B403|nr:hypothetical protein [Sulfitobacter sp. R18_1]MBO9427883.1 hypothetical protein [Sulfitobacter sp. R18_1]
MKDITLSVLTARNRRKANKKLSLLVTDVLNIVCRRTITRDQSASNGLHSSVKAFHFFVFLAASHGSLPIFISDIE